VHSNGTFLNYYTGSSTHAVNRRPKTVPVAATPRCRTCKALQGASIHPAQASHPGLPCPAHLIQLSHSRSRSL